MTREEEIKHKAGSISDGMRQHYASGDECKGYYDGFIDGAKWADSNSTMIDKFLYWLVIESPFADSKDMDKAIESFKKYLEE